MTALIQNLPQNIMLLFSQLDPLLRDSRRKDFLLKCLGASDEYIETHAPRKALLPEINSEPYTYWSAPYRAHTFTHSSDLILWEAMPTSQNFRHSVGLFPLPVKASIIQVVGPHPSTVSGKMLEHHKAFLKHEITEITHHSAAPVFLIYTKQHEGSPDSTAMIGEALLQQHQVLEIRDHETIDLASWVFEHLSIEKKQPSFTISDIPGMGAGEEVSETYLEFVLQHIIPDAQPFTLWLDIGGPLNGDTTMRTHIINALVQDKSLAVMFEDYYIAVPTVHYLPKRLTPAYHAYLEYDGRVYSSVVSPYGGQSIDEYQHKLTSVTRQSIYIDQKTPELKLTDLLSTLKKDHHT